MGGEERKWEERRGNGRRGDGRRWEEERNGEERRGEERRGGEERREEKRGEERSGGTWGSVAAVCHLIGLIASSAVIFSLFCLSTRSFSRSLVRWLVCRQPLYNSSANEA